MCALAKPSPFEIRDRRAVDFTRDGGTTLQTSSAAGFEFSSVCDPCAQGQENECTWISTATATVDASYVVGEVGGGD